MNVDVSCWTVIVVATEFASAFISLGDTEQADISWPFYRIFSVAFGGGCVWLSMPVSASAHPLK
jgi:hypothetical protein